MSRGDAVQESVATLREGGFTLVELVLVILLVSILAFAAMSRVPTGALTLAGEADQLAGDIRYAQALSMTRGERFCIEFSAGTPGSYRMMRSDCGIAVTHPASGAAVVGLRANMTVTGLPNGYVEFDGRGRPVENVLPDTLLAAQAQITLTADGQTRAVVITPDTGRVSQ